jgi:hypothetical protein
LQDRSKFFNNTYRDGKSYVPVNAHSIFGDTLPFKRACGDAGICNGGRQGRKRVPMVCSCTHLDGSIDLGDSPTNQLSPIRVY